MTAHHPKSNERSASTTWSHKPDRMRPVPPEAPARSGAKHAFRGLARRNPRQGITIKVTYKGGTEAWWLIEARGRTIVLPGVLDLHTVMKVVNQDW